MAESDVRMTSVEIREAREDDSDSVLGCLSAAFAPYREQYTPAAYADTVLDESSLRHRLRTMHVLVAVADGEVVGTVGAAIHDDRGHLRGMAVLPGHRGAGIAAQLLSAIEEWLRMQGCTRVSLNTTRPLLAAMKFYEKHGYVRTGRISDFFGMDLIEYEKSLT